MYSKRAIQHPRRDFCADDMLERMSSRNPAIRLPKFASIQWISQLAIPLLVLAAYCVVFRWLVVEYRPLPAGVNLNFVQALLPVALVAAAVFAALGLLARQPLLPTASQTVSPKLIDWVLLLLPLTPIVQYILKNPDLLTPREIVGLLGVFFAAAVVMVMAVPVWLRPVADVSVLRAIGLTMAFLLNSMASISANFLWFEQGDFAIQLAIGVVLVVLVSLLYRSRHRRLLVLLITVFFVSNTLLQTGANKAAPEELQMAEHPLLSGVLEGELYSKPNIYLLIYDAYVPNETMLSYGIDNSAQEEYLRELGFTLYPQTYSIGSYSTASMTSVLNASSQLYGNSRTGASGGGVVQQALHELGYQTYGIFPSDYFFRGIGSSYDVSFPPSRPAGSVLFDAILIGEFRFDIGFDPVSTSGYLIEKEQLFSQPPAHPLFLYSHSNSPGHTQNSGACLPNELELFQKRLDVANQEMKTDLAALLQNDPDAVIIVAGDHGPYLTKNCFSLGEGGYSIEEVTRQDIQDRFGTFLAIRWPSQDYEAYDDIVVLQDIFPAIFAYLYQDVGLLDHRVEPVTIYTPGVIGDAAVDNGIIIGGRDDGEPLFLSQP